MNATKARTLLLVTFIVALGAGMAAGGMIFSRTPIAPMPLTTTPRVTPTTGRAPAGSRLSDDLQLSSEQRDKMKSIWEGTQDRARTCFDEARDLQRKRDDALVALLTDEQKAKYEKISKEYSDQFTSITDKREAIFQEAVEKTKLILNDTQKEKYEQILAKRKGGPSMGGKDMFPPPMPRGERNDRGPGGPGSGPDRGGPGHHQ